MKTYSSHVFFFPFKWKLDNSKSGIFTDLTDLDSIEYCSPSCWERVQKAMTEEDATIMYNEKNYFYKFVHPILYDEVNNDRQLIRHFERKELKFQNSNVYYNIKIRSRALPYRLRVDAMNLNVYDTGMGLLSFYLLNEDESQSHPEDILAINQYGRRLMPPFYADIEYRGETAEYLNIEGLYSSKGHKYHEDFNSYTPSYSWHVASFVQELIDDLASNISIEPIIDDRMFVLSWYKNNSLTNEFVTKELAHIDDSDFSSFWYKFVFVDGGFETCQNNEMKKELLKKATYLRWQKSGSLYGISRYSMVLLTNDTVPPYILTTFNTIYARMVELTIVQRATLLRFSDEITSVSSLSRKEVSSIFNHINSLYKEYIRFINQIYHRDVTAQDQGIELYAILQDYLKMEDRIKDLDHEFQELHEYVSLNEDRNRSQKATELNYLATFFLPATIITGFFGMNKLSDFCMDNGTHYQVILIIVGILATLGIIWNRKIRL